jgi:DNA-binding HxlR family transcriptional regulator
LRVTYRLSARGRSLRPVLEALYAWGDVAATDLGVTVRAFEQV